MTHLWSIAFQTMDSEYEKLKALYDAVVKERDQLRRVCDELAEGNAQALGNLRHIISFLHSKMIVYPEGRMNINDIKTSLELYSTLPHVQERKGKV